MALALVHIHVATYLTDRTSGFGWVLFVILAALGIFTIPTQVFGILVIGIWMVLVVPLPRKRRQLVELMRAAIGVIAGSLLLYLPILLRTQHTTLHSGTLRNVVAYLGLLPRWVVDLPLPVIVLFILGTGIALLPRRQGVPHGRYLLLAILLSHAALIPLGGFPPVRILHYLFFFVAGIGSFGIATLWPRLLPERRTDRPAMVWIGVVILLCGYWGTVRAYHTRTLKDPQGITYVGALAPGDIGTTCCAEGYFVDAGPIVRDWGPTLDLGDAIVAQFSSGMVAALRFYFMEGGRTPVLVHPYLEQRGGLSQLDPYDKLFVVVRRSADQAGDTPTLEDMARALGSAADALTRTFRAPTLVGTYRSSFVFRLERREPRTQTRSPLEPIPFNMLWNH